MTSDGDGGLRPLRTIALPADGVPAIAWLAADRALCAAGDVLSVDLESGATLGRFSRHLDGVVCLALDRSTGIVLSGDAEKALLWNLAGGEVRRRIDGRLGHIDDVDLSADGRLAAIARIGGVDVWRLADGRCLGTLRLADGQATGVRFLPDGEHLLVADRAEGLRLGRVTGEVVWRVADGQAGSRLALSPDGTIAATGGSTGLRLRSVADGGAIRSTPDAGRIAAVALSPDGRLVASGDAGGGVVLRSVADGATTASVAAHAAPVASLAFSPGGDLLLSGGWDGRLRLWRVGGGERLATAP